MRKITLYPYPDGNRCRAYIEPDDLAGEAWPVRRYSEDDIELLEAVVVLPGAEGTQTFSFSFDGTNWVAANAPIASVAALDLFV